MNLCQTFSVFVSFFAILPGTLCGQAVIYKKDCVKIFTDSISYNAQEATFTVAGDTTGGIHHLILPVIDSIAFPDGRTVVFETPAVPPPEKIKRNYLSTDIYNTVFRNINIRFEHLSVDGITGFYTAALANLNTGMEEMVLFGSYISSLDYGTLWYDTHYWFVRAGVNYYPFNYSLINTGRVRFFTGGSLIAGQVIRVREKWTQSSYEYYLKKVFTLSLAWNFGARFYLSDSFHLYLDADIVMAPDLIFSPAAGISVGF